MKELRGKVRKDKKIKGKKELGNQKSKKSFSPPILIFPSFGLSKEDDEGGERRADNKRFLPNPKLSAYYIPYGDGENVGSRGGERAHGGEHAQVTVSLTGRCWLSEPQTRVNASSNFP